MTQRDYLNILRAQLKRLPQSQLDDIIGDFEELFREGVAAGRTEEQVAQGLGPASQVAATLLAETKISSIDRAQSTPDKARGLLGALVAVAALAPLNFLVLFGPFLVTASMVAAFYATGVALAGTSLGIVGLGFTMYMADGSWMPSLPLILSALGLLFASLFGIGILTVMTSVFFKITVSYLKWNLKLIRKSAEVSS